MEKFIEPDPSQPLFLPVDLREWVPEDDLAHFVLAAVERVPMSRFRVNHRGSGKAQYHPRTMLALLIYSYAKGLMTRDSPGRRVRMSIAAPPCAFCLSCGVDSKVAPMAVPAGMKV